LQHRPVLNVAYRQGQYLFVSTSGSVSGASVWGEENLAIAAASSTEGEELPSNDASTGVAAFLFFKKRGIL
jgi:hypothetical protein